ncbi:hypothetical protein GCM10008955_08660 [Deinococcus malanensis]|uniref:DDE Tnp4 domain-containing protein n=1 Tax=Deinococcus malanensis TaxID=1706855 RepID=A0ABQ2EMK8_9DEIO|nr:hypothetical protein GCM10008955_08660 [Deinococcus malanensis]
MIAMVPLTFAAATISVGRPANLHDTTVAYELNLCWPDFGGPQVIGDKGYCALGFIYPPKKNTRYDTGGGKTATRNYANALKPCSLN